jgi:hypothetical protein
MNAAKEFIATNNPDFRDRIWSVLLTGLKKKRLVREDQPLEF